MKIKNIQIPVTGQTEDGVIRLYGLYFGTKLGIPLLGISALSINTVVQSTAISQPTDDLFFAGFIQACRDHGVSYETRHHRDSWASAFHEADPGNLVMLPFDKRLQWPDFKAEDLLAARSRTVLCCPDHYIDIESIALAYDGSDHAQRALDLAVWLSEKAIWPLSVLMVVENQEQGVRWMDDVEAFLDTLPINSTTIILSGPVETALERFMREGSVEMLIMGGRRQQDRRTGSIGHTAAYMLSVADYPLLRAKLFQKRKPDSNLNRLFCSGK